MCSRFQAHLYSICSFVGNWPVLQIPTIASFHQTIANVQQEIMHLSAINAFCTERNFDHPEPKPNHKLCMHNGHRRDPVMPLFSFASKMPVRCLYQLSNSKFLPRQYAIQIFSNATKSPSTYLLSLLLR